MLASTVIIFDKFNVHKPKMPNEQWHHKMVCLIALTKNDFFLKVGMLK